jgi:hypothetical protein
MERLVIAILKLLLKLAWILFRFGLRLVLFAWSGDWRKLDKLEAELRDALAKAKQGTPVKRQHKSTWAKRPAKRAQEEGPWPFEFAPELTALEPDSELQGGEASVGQPIKLRRLPGKRRPPPTPELPLALALRDPKLIRDAMVLTAVLGPRTRRARRF